MKISTFSVVAGTTACNATCPFCVSKMTTYKSQTSDVNWRNFDIACNLAVQSNVTTAMITGKGEPTLYPDLVTRYVETIKKWNIPLIELQTNGLKLRDHAFLTKHLPTWYQLGMTVISVSVVHWKAEENAKIYCRNGGGYPHEIGDLVRYLHGFGFSVRLSCVMQKNFVGDADSVMQMVKFAQDNNVDQLTLVPLNYPAQSASEEVKEWAKQHVISADNRLLIQEWFGRSGTPLLALPHGATIYDVNGQNVCLSNCLGQTANKDEVRNLIFYPDGRLGYDWQYTGAVIL